MDGQADNLMATELLD